MFDFKRKTQSVYNFSEEKIKRAFIFHCVRDKFKTWFDKDGVDIVAVCNNDMRVFLLSQSQMIVPDKIDPLMPYCDFIHYYHHFGLSRYQWFIRTVPPDIWFSRGLGNMVTEINIPISLICKPVDILPLLNQGNSYGV